MNFQRKWTMVTHNLNSLFTDYFRPSKTHIYTHTHDPIHLEIEKKDYSKAKTKDYASTHWRQNHCLTLVECKHKQISSITYSNRIIYGFCYLRSSLCINIFLFSILLCVYECVFLFSLLKIHYNGNILKAAGSLSQLKPLLFPSSFWNDVSHLNEAHLYALHGLFSILLLLFIYFFVPL